MHQETEGQLNHRNCCFRIMLMVYDQPAEVLIAFTIILRGYLSFHSCTSKNFSITFQ